MNEDRCHDCGEPIEPGAYGADGLICRMCVEKRDSLLEIPSCPAPSTSVHSTRDDIRLLIQEAGVQHARSCPHGSGLQAGEDGVYRKVYGGLSSLTDEDSFDVCTCEARKVYEAAQRLAKDFK